MNTRNLHKTLAMDESRRLIITYEDENGNRVEEVHDVHETIKEYIEVLIETNSYLEMEVDYWKSMMGYHITAGVKAN